MASPLTRAALQRLAPRPRSAEKAAIWDGYVSALEAFDPAEFIAAGITTRARLTQLLAQWAWESGGFTILWESGAYSARRIVEVFGPGHHSARIGADEARELARKTGDVALEDGTTAPARAYAVFERAYGLGNPKKAAELGNTDPGDGYKHRGFGIQQITGRTDHERLLKGDYTPTGAIRAALAEWREKGCNAPADRGDCRRVTKLVNGGSEGLAGRVALVAKAERIWPDDPEWPAPAPVPPALGPKPRAITVARQSPSIWAGVAAFFATVWQGLVALFVAIGEFLQLLPAAKDEAETLTGPIKDTAGLFGVPVEQVCTGVAAVAILVFLIRHTDLRAMHMQIMAALQPAADQAPAAQT